ncbi:beta-glucuronidase [Miniimonas arenae]|uniref:Beta-glucuronidase n=1 Tax=Miniimonas arenae TaxID=676201 RepID=A0A5C5BE19_9MICO|nr:glycoside hydrolase family 2 TIM barrel-domain containing protein [Miniimonas arenae]TNU76242.1 beta-glucuronidase [Miniimonas arenae]
MPGVRTDGTRDGELGLAVALTDTPGGVALRAEVRDAVGHLVAGGTLDTPDRDAPDGEPTVAGRLTIPDVHAWAPGDGYRYDLALEVPDGEGCVLDRYDLKVGMRTVRVAGARLLVNDEPVHLRGFGRHEDQLVHGKGHDPVLAVHDHALLAWFGANSFRTAHYPHAEEVLDLADEDGLLVIDEAPAVGQNEAFSGGRLAPATFGEGPGFIGAAAQEAHARLLRELVARDRNHPSVVAWSVANEPTSSAPLAGEYFGPLFALARTLDPTRPVTFANEGRHRPETCRVTPMADLLLLNRYYGWYEDYADLESAEQHLRAELATWAALGKPIVVSEYGADALPGTHHADPEPWSEEYQAAVLEMSGRVFDGESAVVGEHVWAFADFATAPGLIRADGNRKGVLTRDRRPKAAAWVLRRRWRARAAGERADGEREEGAPTPEGGVDWGDGGRSAE